MKLLDTLDGWIDDIPPLPTPQRFGNLAFRAWGKRLHDVRHSSPSRLCSLLTHPTQETPTLLSTLLPEEAIPHLSPYLLTSFGSFLRMDYGTGHETSFALFLCGMALLRIFPLSSPDELAHAGDEERDKDKDKIIERALTLLIYPRYLRLTWRLQDAYRLEPAGSHGVWGLDDSNFLGYMWGSAQLRVSSLPPSSILLPGAGRKLPPTNLYNILINRIHDVKTGPFHEHSSQLHAIAVGVSGWAKVGRGLGKMYEVCALFSFSLCAVSLFFFLSLDAPTCHLSCEASAELGGHGPGHRPWYRAYVVEPIRLWSLVSSWRCEIACILAYDLSGLLWVQFWRYTSKMERRTLLLGRLS